MSDIADAVQALVGDPVGDRAGAGDVGMGAPLAWYEYEWDSSRHCIGCGSGEWSDDMRGRQGELPSPGYVKMSDGNYHHPDCPAMRLNAAIERAGQ